jgi:hypothetical protein
VFLIAAGGCGDDDGASSSGRGSAACRDWQDAICDFAADACGAIARVDCDDNYQAITCSSDEQASECANAFNEASCSAPPAACDLSDVVDPAPAQQACDDLLSRLCARVVECEMAPSEAACVEEASAGIDCDAAVGYSLDYEGCLGAIDALACEAVELPDVCDDVIKIQLN